MVGGAEGRAFFKISFVSRGSEKIMKKWINHSSGLMGMTVQNKNKWITGWFCLKCDILHPLDKECPNRDK